MNCPFCGSPLTPRWGTEGILRFTCGTLLHDSAPSRRNQTSRCVETEVGKLEERIERLEVDAKRLSWLLDRGLAWRGCYNASWWQGEWIYKNQDAIGCIDAAMEAKP